jgi:Fe-Mn family superoxide dismutase
VKLGVDTMLARLSDVPEDLRQSIRNNGGGYVNHALYWNCMSPPNTTDGAATGLRVPAEGSKILAAITRDFGSFDAFRTKFTDLATALFGSGWVFLYVDGNTKTLKLMATANQVSRKIWRAHSSEFLPS